MALPGGEFYAGFLVDGGVQTLPDPDLKIQQKQSKRQKRQRRQKQVLKAQERN